MKAAFEALRELWNQGGAYGKFLLLRNLVLVALLLASVWWCLP